MDKLKSWRDKQGLTSTEAARLAGISQAQWSRYETSRAAIGAKRVALLSQITGIPRHELRPDLFEAAQ
jgi:transcriptional regulator with XRE-family HTH domain